MTILLIIQLIVRGGGAVPEVTVFKGLRYYSLPKLPPADLESYRPY